MNISSDKSKKNTKSGSKPSKLKPSLLEKNLKDNFVFYTKDTGGRKPISLAVQRLVNGGKITPQEINNKIELIQRETISNLMKKYPGKNKFVTEELKKMQKNGDFSSKNVPNASSGTINTLRQRGFKKLIIDTAKTEGVIMAKAVERLAGLEYFSKHLEEIEAKAIKLGKVAEKKAKIAETKGREEKAKEEENKKKETEEAEQAEKEKLAKEQIEAEEKSAKEKSEKERLEKIEKEKAQKEKEKQEKQDKTKAEEEKKKADEKSQKESAKKENSNENDGDSDERESYNEEKKERNEDEVTEKTNEEMEDLKKSVPNFDDKVEAEKKKEEKQAQPTNKNIIGKEAEINDKDSVEKSKVDGSEQIRNYRAEQEAQNLKVAVSAMVGMVGSAKNSEELKSIKENLEKAAEEYPDNENVKNAIGVLHTKETEFERSKVEQEEIIKLKQKQILEKESSKNKDTATSSETKKSLAESPEYKEVEKRILKLGTIILSASKAEDSKESLAIIEKAIKDLGQLVEDKKELFDQNLKEQANLSGQRLEKYRAKTAVRINEKAAIKKAEKERADEVKKSQEVEAEREERRRLEKVAIKTAKENEEKLAIEKAELEKTISESPEYKEVEKKDQEDSVKIRNLHKELEAINSSDLSLDERMNALEKMKEDYRAIKVGHLIPAMKEFAPLFWGAYNSTNSEIKNRVVEQAIGSEKKKYREKIELENEKNREVYGEAMEELEKIAKKEGFKGLDTYKDQNTIATDASATNTIAFKGFDDYVSWDYDDYENRRVIIGSETLGNFNEWMQLDPENSKESIKQIMQHEAQHHEGPAKRGAATAEKKLEELLRYNKFLRSQGLPSKTDAQIFKENKDKYYGGDGKNGAGYEMQTELQRNNKIFKNTDAFIETQAKYELASEIVHRGLKYVLEMEYTIENADNFLPIQRYGFIKPKLIEKVVLRMEEMRKELLRKYEVKVFAESPEYKEVEKRVLKLGTVIMSTARAEDDKEGLAIIEKAIKDLDQLIDDKGALFDQKLREQANWSGQKLEKYRAKFEARINENVVKEKTSATEVKRNNKVDESVNEEVVQEEDEVTMALEHFALGNEVRNAQLGLLLAKMGKKMNLPPESSAVLLAVYDTAEYRELHLSEELDSLNYDIAKAKSGDNAEEIQKLFEQKKNLARNFVESENPRALVRIQKAKNRLESIKEIQTMKRVPLSPIKSAQKNKIRINCLNIIKREKENLNAEANRILNTIGKSAIAGSGGAASAMAAGGAASVVAAGLGTMKTSKSKGSASINIESKFKMKIPKSERDDNSSSPVKIPKQSFTQPTQQSPKSPLQNIQQAQNNRSSNQPTETGGSSPVLPDISSEKPPASEKGSMPVQHVSAEVSRAESMSAPETASSSKDEVKAGKNETGEKSTMPNNTDSAPVQSPIPSETHSSPAENVDSTPSQKSDQKASSSSQPNENVSSPNSNPKESSDSSLSSLSNSNFGNPESSKSSSKEAPMKSILEDKINKLIEPEIQKLIMDKIKEAAKEQAESFEKKDGQDVSSLDGSRNNISPNGQSEGNSEEGGSDIGPQQGEKKSLGEMKKNALDSAKRLNEMRKNMPENMRNLGRNINNLPENMGAKAQEIRDKAAAAKAFAERMKKMSREDLKKMAKRQFDLRKAALKKQLALKTAKMKENMKKKLKINAKHGKSPYMSCLFMVMMLLAAVNDIVLDVFVGITVDLISLVVAVTGVGLPVAAAIEGIIRSAAGIVDSITGIILVIFTLITGGVTKSSLSKKINSVLRLVIGVGIEAIPIVNLFFTWMFVVAVNWYIMRRDATEAEQSQQ